MHRNAEWVKAIHATGRIENYNWGPVYEALRYATNTSYPGYLWHEVRLVEHSMSLRCVRVCVWLTRCGVLVCSGRGEDRRCIGMRGPASGFFCLARRQWIQVTTPTSTSAWVRTS